MQSFKISQEQLDSWLQEGYFLEDVVKELTGKHVCNCYMTIDNNSECVDNFLEKTFVFNFIEEV